MALNHLDVVHVRLPVFYVAFVVAAQHPRLVIAPYHGTNRCVVRLFGYQSIANAKLENFRAFLLAF